MGRITGLGRLLPGWLRAPSRGTAEYRYELERKLHDGPAEGLSALAIELALISATAGDRQLAVRIAEMGGNVCQLVDRLRLLRTVHRPSIGQSRGPGCTLILGCGGAVLVSPKTRIGLVVLGDVTAFGFTCVWLGVSVKVVRSGLEEAVQQTDG
ncbi:hypothetical protein [Saccharopolyspora elongata]|nr:hypothetical protein [Saccharopolyspora elongata]